MDLHKIDLNLLSVLDTLLRLESVSRSAEALGMSQPSISFALNKLRVLFGDPLFIRSAGGMRPTPRAQQLAQPLRGVMDDLRTRVFLPQDFDPSTTEREFCFNMIDVGELAMLPTIFESLRQVAPRARIKVVSRVPEVLVDELQSGAVDLAIGHFPGLHSAALFQQRLCSHSFTCLVRQGHPVLGASMSLAQFLAADHLVVRPEGRSPDAFERQLADSGHQRRVVVSLPHFMAAGSLVARSDLIATVPYAIGEALVAAGGLQMLRPPLEVAPPDVRQHWHARFNNDPANRWLRSHVAGLFVDSTPPREAPRGTPLLHSQWRTPSTLARQ